MPDERAQAHTLEGVAAAMVVLASVLFALQVTAVTPLTASTASQHIENQEAAQAAGVLAAAAADGSLSRTLRYWNATSAEFHRVEYDGRYVSGGPPTPFGHDLNRTFRDEGIAFNVNVYYLTAKGRERRRLVYLGQPSDHAAVATRTVTLLDDDPLYGTDYEPTNVTLADAAASSSFYAPDYSSGSGLYNVVVVEVVAWRM